MIEHPPRTNDLRVNFSCATLHKGFADDVSSAILALISAGSIAVYSMLSTSLRRLDIKPVTLPSRCPDDRLDPTSIRCSCWLPRHLCNNFSQIALAFGLGRVRLPLPRKYESTSLCDYLICTCECPNMGSDIGHPTNRGQSQNEKI